MVSFVASTVVETTRNVFGMSGTLCNFLPDREGVVVFSRVCGALGEKAGSDDQPEERGEVDHDGIGNESGNDVGIM